jgi:hypothetical protein
MQETVGKKVVENHRIKFKIDGAKLKTILVTKGIKFFSMGEVVDKFEL